MTRLQQFLEKRFNQPEDDELHKLYLNSVHYVYENEHVRTVDLSARLEPSFQVGLNKYNLIIFNLLLFNKRTN